MLGHVGHDLRLAVRSLLANRLHTAIVVLTLALGVGINASVFSILDSVLFRPLPFKDGNRLVELVSYDQQRKFTYAGFSRPLLLQWRTQKDLFDHVEAYERSSFVFSDNNGAEMVAGVNVTPGLLPMLGARIASGRLFTNDDGRGGTDHIAIVSDRFWRSQLHGDESAIGKSITLDGDRYALVGILPASFRFPSELEDVWIPSSAEAPPSGPERSSLAPNLVPVAHLAAGVKLEPAQQQVIARGSALQVASGGGAGIAPVGSDGTITAQASTLGLSVDDRTRVSLLALGGAVAFLLLIVCANLANLALSQAMTKARAFSVRAALGASRADLVRETMVEHLAIGVLAGVCGIAVSALALRIALTVMPTDMTTRSFNIITLDWQVVALTMGMGIITSVIFGLPPALMASRASVADVLRRDTRSSTGSTFAGRLRSGLVVAEVSLSIILLVGAALMTRSFVKLQAIDKGLNPTGLISLTLGLPTVGYAEVVNKTVHTVTCVPCDQFLLTAVDRVRHLPGVTAVSIGTVPPQISTVKFGQLEVADHPRPKGAVSITSQYQVLPDFFTTVGTPLLEGRTFASSDRDEAAVVSASFAKDHWPDGHALGGQFRYDTRDPWMTVIGVAATIRNGSSSDGTDRGQIYVQFGRALNGARPVRPTSTISGFRTIVVRATDPAAVALLLGPAIHSADPHVVVDKREFVEHQFADAIAKPRIVFLMMAVFAVFALILAAAGIYGVLSCLVQQRLREIGIRIALGASPSSAGGLILRSGLVLTMAGMAVGVAMAVVLMRAMRSLLYNVEPTDPASVATVVTLLLLTALAASWRPARRAMRVDPIILLRED